MAEGELRDIFSRIAGGANDLRRAYEEAREAGKEPPYSQIAEFAREARKELEPFLWKYKSKREHAYELAQAEPRWCLLQGRRVASRQPHRLEITGSIPAPATNNNGGEMKMATDKSICRQLGRLLKEEPWGSDMLRDYSLRLEYQAKQAAECPKIQREAYERAAIVRNAITSLMQATYKKGSEVQMKQDPILAEVASQICSSGICLAERSNPVRCISEGSRGKKERQVTCYEGAKVLARKVYPNPVEARKATRRFVKEYETKGTAKLAASACSKLPICSPAQARKLENCILDVKAKLPARCKPYWSKPPKKQPGGCYSPFSVCRASLGCRLGGAKKYEAKA